MGVACKAGHQGRERKPHYYPHQIRTPCTAYMETQPLVQRTLKFGLNSVTYGFNLAKTPLGREGQMGEMGQCRD